MYKKQKRKRREKQFLLSSVIIEVFSSDKRIKSDEEKKRLFCFGFLLHPNTFLCSFEYSRWKLRRKRGIHGSGVSEKKRFSEDLCAEIEQEWGNSFCVCIQRKCTVLYIHLNSMGEKIVVGGGERISVRSKEAMEKVLKLFDTFHKIASMNPVWTNMCVVDSPAVWCGKG